MDQLQRQEEQKRKEQHKGEKKNKTKQKKTGCDFDHEERRRLRYCMYNTYFFYIGLLMVPSTATPWQLYVLKRQVSARNTEVWWVWLYCMVVCMCEGEGTYLGILLRSTTILFVNFFFFRSDDEMSSCCGRSQSAGCSLIRSNSTNNQEVSFDLISSETVQLESFFFFFFWKTGRPYRNHCLKNEVRGNQWDWMRKKKKPAEKTLTQHTPMHLPTARYCWLIKLIQQTADSTKCVDMRRGKKKKKTATETKWNCLKISNTDLSCILV